MRERFSFILTDLWKLICFSVQITLNPLEDTMSRKHFRALADALKDNDASPALIHAVAQVCSDCNPNFSWDRFKEAAGWSESCAKIGQAL